MATAELFCREGAKVLINDLDGDVAEQASKEIEGETVEFHPLLVVDGDGGGEAEAIAEAPLMATRADSRNLAKPIAPPAANDG